MAARSRRFPVPGKLRTAAAAAAAAAGSAHVSPPALAPSSQRLSPPPPRRLLSPPPTPSCQSSPEPSSARSRGGPRGFAALRPAVCSRGYVRGPDPLPGRPSCKRRTPLGFFCCLGYLGGQEVLEGLRRRQQGNSWGLKYSEIMRRWEVISILRTILAL